MSTQPTFDWSDSVPDNKDLGPDRLGRARYAEFLTSFLYGQNKDKSYVLNLNSGWGTGKTYFLKRWKHDLDRNHPIIYIDAWKDDHSTDPFISVVSSLITQLRARTDKNEESTWIKGIEFSSRLIKHVAPIVIGSLSKKYIGLSYDEISQGNENVPSDGNNNNIDQVAQKLSSLLLSDHEKRMSSITSLKETIKLWIDAVIGQASGSLVGPTFVIIDELDRCRPDYAVKILEVVKHIFDIPGVFFIIATDTEQLQHAIKVVYGREFNAQIYLSRFFDSRFSLQKVSLISIIEAHCKTLSAFDKNYQKDNNIILWPLNYNDAENITAVLDIFDIPARDALQIVNRISAIIFSSGSNSQFDLLYLTTLLCLQVRDNDFYNNVVGTKQLGDIDKHSADRIWLDSPHTISFHMGLDGVHCDFKNEKTKEVPIKEYYRNTFARFSSVFSIPQYEAGLISESKVEISEYINLHASENDKDPKSPFYSKQWLRYSYVNLGFHRVERDKYKDLVEMAKSFD
ncbi:hypothetical protein GWQ31_16040 [Aeromonas sp. 2MA4]|uniref:KAP family P-loop NTPase fold protein n=1 Tax=Aeromonas sp. 2MA4 TaxID=2699195 RepID=UPI0023DE0F2D|nr:P-loop NTPase fold protein [Aeromonas sp. 2MA4]MDF2392855.1 hypothetical protein [Aeromonas sp. 2MA4]